MSKRLLQVGIVQFSMENEASKNIEKAITAIEDLADQGAECIVLPELFLTKYFCQKEDVKFFSLAEDVPGKTTKIFEEIAGRRSVSIVLSLFEKVNTGIYFNTVAYISEKGYQGKYRKTHIPDDPGFYEKFYFAPGDLGFSCYPLRSFNLAPLICWDQWFPEAARIMALKGAEVILYPTAIGGEPDNQDEFDSSDMWQRAMIGHAAVNQVPIVASNRIGTEDGFEISNFFYRRSFITDYTGKVVAEGSRDKEEVLISTIDLDKAEDFRSSWGIFRDRRPDLYKTLLDMDGSEE